MSETPTCSATPRSAGSWGRPAGSWTATTTAPTGSWRSPPGCHECRATGPIRAAGPGGQERVRPRCQLRLAHHPLRDLRAGAGVRAQRGEVVVDDREGEFGWSVAGGADHVDHEPVDQGLEPGRLALGVELRWQLAAADRLGDARDQRVVKLAP